jgi:DNA repair protein RecO (recombination protein O)
LKNLGTDGRIAEHGIMSSQMLKKDEAICIRTLDYSETSQIVTLFAREHGKLDAMARGSKRAKSPFDGPIEIFSYGQIVFSEKGDQKLATLAEFAQQPRFLGLRKKLFALNCSLFAAELIESFTLEFDPYPELFDVMQEFLESQMAQTQDFASLRVLIVFQLELLRQIGSGLILDHCANCKMPYDPQWPAAYFSSSSHGLICRDCEASFSDKIRLDKTAVSFLTTEHTENAERIGISVLQQIEKMLIGHFTQLMHHIPKMAAYFNDM